MPSRSDEPSGHRVAVVIVTYSGDASMLSANLDAIEAAGGVEWTIVVDTGGRVAANRFDVVRMPNLGYGAAVNRGVASARARGATAVAVLNDDIVVRPGWLAPLLAALDDDTFEGAVGAAQPKMLLAGTDPPVVNSLGVGLDPTWQGHDIGDGLVDGMPGTGEGGPIEIFSGGAVLFSLAFLDDTGGFDERYFLYYEDVDLALRGRSLGWRYLLVPDSVVDHVRGATTGSTPDRTRYLQERNRLWVVARFGPPRRIAASVWLSVRRLRHRPIGVHARALVVGGLGMLSRIMERRAATASRRRA